MLACTHADAFTDVPYGGNPACVVVLPGAGAGHDISTADKFMQNVALEMSALPLRNTSLRNTSEWPHIHCPQCCCVHCVVLARPTSECCTNTCKQLSLPRSPSCPGLQIFRTPILSFSVAHVSPISRTYPVSADLSETAFIQRDTAGLTEEQTFAIRWFTPTDEVQ